MTSPANLTPAVLYHATHCSLRASIALKGLDPAFDQALDDHDPLVVGSIWCFSTPLPLLDATPSTDIYWFSTVGLHVEQGGAEWGSADPVWQVFDVVPPARLGIL